MTIVQFAATFRASMQRADTLFDYHMRQMALALQDSTFERPEAPVANIDVQHEVQGLIAELSSRRLLNNMVRRFSSEPLR